MSCSSHGGRGIVSERYIPFRSAHGLSRVDCITKSWNEITVRYHEKHAGPGKAWEDMSSEKTTLVILLDQKGGYAEARHHLSEPTPRRRYDPGFAVWVPANHTIWGFSEHASVVRDIRLTFDPTQLELMLGDELDTSLVQTPLLMLYDRRISSIAHLLSEECNELDPSARLLGESLTTALFAALFRAWKRKEDQARKGSGLASWRLRRSIEYLDDKYAEDISLSVFARNCCLSQSQFARAFRTSTGVPPYRWALNARIRRAQELLANNDLSISVIAVQVGFADQSHFTKAFRRLSGVSPGSLAPRSKRLIAASTVQNLERTSLLKGSQCQKLYYNSYER
jgi:AraC family transcriptional regulator